jgi:hypothetical protein
LRERRNREKEGGRERKKEREREKRKKFKWMPSMNTLNKRKTSIRQENSLDLLL